jgi:hypothetical protein
MSTTGARNLQKAMSDQKSICIGPRFQPAVKMCLKVVGRGVFYSIRFCRLNSAQKGGWDRGLAQRIGAIGGAGEACAPPSDLRGQTALRSCSPPANPSRRHRAPARTFTGPQSRMRPPHLKTAFSDLPTAADAERICGLLSPSVLNGEGAKQARSADKSGPRAAGSADGLHLLARAGSKNPGLRSRP